MFALALLAGLAVVHGAQNATFRVPFEIKFEGCNQFGFTVNHLDTFINATTEFFSVDSANLIIAFIKETVASDIIEVGFTISVNTFQEEDRIRRLSTIDYRSYLQSEASTLPFIPGVVPKYETCPTAQYSTFYHYDVECLWLCDHDTVYLNDTNRCRPTVNMTSTEWVPESHTVYLLFVGIGYGSSASLTAAIALLFMLKTQIQKQRVPADQETLQSDTETSTVASKRRESIYKYQLDTEDEDQSKCIEFSVNSPMPQSKGANADDITLTMEQDQDQLAVEEEELEDEVFVLEEIECAEQFKEEKAKIIEQSRRHSSDLVDEFKRLDLSLNESGLSLQEAVEERENLERRLSGIKQNAVKELRKLKDD